MQCNVSCLPCLPPVRVPRARELRLLARFVCSCISGLLNDAIGVTLWIEVSHCPIYSLMYNLPLKLASKIRKLVAQLDCRTRHLAPLPLQTFEDAD